MLNLLNGVNNATPGILVDFFKSEVTDKYSTQICSRDVEFLKNELVEKLSGTPFANVMQKIVSVWSVLSEKNQKIIWDYLELLVTVTKRL